MLPSISSARRLKQNKTKFDFRSTTTNGDKSGSKTSIKAGTKLESKPSTKLGSKTGIKANTKLGSKPSTRTSARLQSKTSIKAHIKFGSKAGAKLAIATGHKPESISLAPQPIDTVYQCVEERLIPSCDTYTCLL